jgi:hypothetical protein
VYLPNVGLMLALSWATFRLPYPYPYIAIAMIGTFYLTKLLYIIPMYRSQHHYVEHSITDFPDQWALYLWRGLMAQKNGQKFSAMSAYLLGLRHRPNDYKLNYNLAGILKELGFPVESKKYYIIAGECLKDEYVDDKETVEAIDKARVELEAQIDKESGKNRIVLPGRQ